MATFQSQPGNPAQSDQKPNGHQQGFGQRVDHLNESAHQLIDEARSAVQDLTQSIDLRGRVERNPYGMVLAAVGVGYVLGGGLFTPFTGRLLRLGARLAMLPFVKDELLGMAEAAISGAVRGASDVGGQGQTPSSSGSHNV
jgi:hypothetical protein